MVGASPRNGPLGRVLEVSPCLSERQGGTEVHVRISNLDPSASLEGASVVFGTRKTPGYLVGNGTLRCITPVHSPGSVLVSVELLSGAVLTPADKPVWFEFVPGGADASEPNHRRVCGDNSFDHRAGTNDRFDKFDTSASVLSLKSDLRITLRLEAPSCPPSPSRPSTSGSFAPLIQSSSKTTISMPKGISLKNVLERLEFESCLHFAADIAPWLRPMGPDAGEIPGLNFTFQSNGQPVTAQALYEQAVWAGNLTIIVTQAEPFYPTSFRYDARNAANSATPIDNRKRNQFGANSANYVTNGISGLRVSQAVNMIQRTWRHSRVVRASNMIKRLLGAFRRSIAEGGFQMPDIQAIAAYLRRTNKIHAGASPSRSAASPFKGSVLSLTTRLGLAMAISMPGKGHPDSVNSVSERRAFRWLRSTCVAIVYQEAVIYFDQLKAVTTSDLQLRARWPFFFATTLQRLSRELLSRLAPMFPWFTGTEIMTLVDEMVARATDLAFRSDPSSFRGGNLFRLPVRVFGAVLRVILESIDHALSRLETTYVNIHLLELIATCGMRECGVRALQMLQPPRAPIMASLQVVAPDEKRTGKNDEDTETWLQLVLPVWPSQTAAALYRDALFFFDVSYAWVELENPNGNGPRTRLDPTALCQSLGNAADNLIVRLRLKKIWDLPILSDRITLDTTRIFGEDAGFNTRQFVVKMGGNARSLCERDGNFAADTVIMPYALEKAGKPQYFHMYNSVTQRFYSVCCTYAELLQLLCALNAAQDLAQAIDARQAFSNSDVLLERLKELMVVYDKWQASKVVGSSKRQTTDDDEHNVAKNRWLDLATPLQELAEGTGQVWDGFYTTLFPTKEVELPEIEWTVPKVTSRRASISHEDSDSDAEILHQPALPQAVAASSSIPQIRSEIGKQERANRARRAGQQQPTQENWGFLIADSKKADDLKPRPKTAEEETTLCVKPNAPDCLAPAALSASIAGSSLFQVAPGWVTSTIYAQPTQQLVVTMPGVVAQLGGALGGISGAVGGGAFGLASFGPLGALVGAGVGSMTGTAVGNKVAVTASTLDLSNSDGYAFVRDASGQQKLFHHKAGHLPGPEAIVLGAVMNGTIATCGSAYRYAKGKCSGQELAGEFMQNLAHGAFMGGSYWVPMSLLQVGAQSSTSSMVQSMCSIALQNSTPVMLAGMGGIWTAVRYLQYEAKMISHEQFVADCFVTSCGNMLGIAGCFAGLACGVSGGLAALVGSFVGSAVGVAGYEYWRAGHAQKQRQELVRIARCVLGVPDTATREVVMSRYRLLARYAHPDRNIQPDARQVFATLGICRQVLCSELPSETKQEQPSLLEHVSNAFSDIRHICDNISQDGSSTASCSDLEELEWEAPEQVEPLQNVSIIGGQHVNVPPTEFSSEPPESVY